MGEGSLSPRDVNDTGSAQEREDDRQAAIYSITAFFITLGVLSEALSGSPQQMHMYATH